MGMGNFGEGILDLLREKMPLVVRDLPGGESEHFDVVAVHTGQLQIPKS